MRIEWWDFFERKLKESKRTLTVEPFLVLKNLIFCLSLRKVESLDLLIYFFCQDTKNPAVSKSLCLNSEGICAIVSVDNELLVST